MEIKVLFEIEEGSKPIIENLSKALMVLGNTAVISSPSGNIIGKVEKFVQTEPAEEEYARQEMKNWQTNDVKDIESEEEASKKEEPDSEKEPERDEVLKAFTKFHAVSLADIQPEDFNALAQIYIELGGKF